MISGELVSVPEILTQLQHWLSVFHAPISFLVAGAGIVILLSIFLSGGEN